MISIQDNYMSKEHYDDLTSLWIEYNKVHWVGVKSAPSNALYQLVHKTFPAKKDLTGATAWYNIRPIDPQWHDDIDSYCTQNKVQYYPDKKPDYTYLYYVKTPDEGGELELETGDILTPKTNRLLCFPCSYKHRVKPYKGNRVSIGIIWWYDLPKIYGNLGEYDNVAIDRVWEKEDLNG
tara:strand:+ start:1061 stop:1597 length:537 start_codon:yes stop_codon:yes gene_type:complete